MQATLPKLARARRRLSPTRRVPEVLQFEVTECGIACLSMVLAHHGKWVPLEQMRHLCGSSRDGISAGSLARAAKQMGLVTKGFGVKPDELRNLPMPQIVFWEFNHFVVLERIEGDVVDLVDPAVGRRRMRMADLEAGYSGVTLCMAPAEGFKRQGSAPSVLEDARKAASGVGGAIAVIVMVSFGMSLLMALVPALTSIFIDYLLVKRGSEVWRFWFIAGVVGFGLTLGPILWMQRAGTQSLQTRLALSMATRIVSQLFRVPLDYFSRRFGGEIAGRVMLADGVAGSVSGAMVTMITASIQLLVVGLAMLAYSVHLTLVAFALVLGHLLLVRWILARSGGLGRLLALERGRYESLVVNALGLAEHTRATGSDASMLQRVLDRYITMIDSEQRNAPVAALLLSLPGVMTGVLMAIITGFSAYEVIRGEFTIGVFVAFNAMAYLLISPSSQIVNAFSQMSNASGNFARVNDLLDVEPEPAAPAQGAEPERWDLRTVDLSLSYGSVQVLGGVGVSIPAGRFVGLCGPVGSGKSTLVNLLAAATQPSAGEILVGGGAIGQVGRDLFCRSVVLVPQRDHIFEGSVLDNITMWDPAITEEEVAQACRLCMIHDDIARRPGGYRSRLREGGADISGGQRQRIALARAVVRRPKVLLLDESTSALDSQTEAAVLANLRTLDVTLVFATHRMPNLRLADEIVVMAGGCVSEQGDHETLMNANGLYARLVADSREGTV